MSGVDTCTPREERSDPLPPRPVDEALSNKAIASRLFGHGIPSA